MNEYDSEPIPGLPEYLPEGEEILWQGAPSWQSLSKRAFHLHWLLGYFAILAVWQTATSFYDGFGLLQALSSLSWLGMLTAIVMGLVLLFAWLVARTTIYTLTNRRIVLRFGIALPMSINLPFSRINAAAIKAYPDGSGDISISLKGDSRVSYLIIWPHSRPWRFKSPEPTLRCIPDAAKVADLLGRTFTQTHDSYQKSATLAASGAPQTQATHQASVLSRESL